MSELVDDIIINDSIGWDIENWKKSISFFKKHIKFDKSMQILELGTGASSGGYSHFFASNGFDVVCSDFPKVYENAKAFHKKACLEQYISYESINALDIPYNDKFDIIVFKSLLGGIGRWGDTRKFEDVIKSIYDALKPKGYMIFAENLKATFFHEIFRNKFGNGRKGWTYINIKDYEKIVKKFFSFYKFDTTGFLGCFGRNEIQRQILGRLDQKIFKKIIPQNYNYIGFCIAQKSAK